MTLAPALAVENQKSDCKHPPAVLCAHCTLPVAPGLVDPAAEHQFCCHGCRTVYAIIHTCRLDRYYQFRQADGAIPEPAHTTGKRYREFDDPAFLDLHAPLQGDGTRRTDFYLEGVHCAACVWLVEKLPQVLPAGQEGGVIAARLDLAKSLVTLTWTGSSLSRIARMLDSLGYPPHPARSASARHIRTLDGRRQLVRIGVAGACAGNAMLLATALYAGFLSSMAPAYTLLFRTLSMGIGMLAIGWPGMVFFRGAFAALRTRTPHLDLPIALGLAAGALVGVINTIFNRGEIYFDSLCVLIFLLLVGRFLQYRQQTASDDALELLFSLTPTSARRIKRAEPELPTAAAGDANDRSLSAAAGHDVGTNSAEHVEDVPIAALNPGDIIEILPGECVPADGAIIAGTSTLDESLLTGESLPKQCVPGDPAFAGTVNLASRLRVRVAAAGEATRVGKLMRLVTECARQKAPIVLLADRIAGRFLLVILTVAVLTFGYWFMRGASAAVDHAVAILIVACPCALGLATPLAVSVSIGRAARRSILIKGGATLERLAKPGLLLLDKTGTITFGRFALAGYVGDDLLKPLIAAVESQSTHPIARALVEALGSEGRDDGVPSVVRPGNIIQHRQGITATLAAARGTPSQIAIGSPAFIAAQAGPTPAWLALQLAAAIGQGLTPILIAVDGAVAAACFLGDQIRPEVAATLAALRVRGWSIGILSGDHPAVIAGIARQLGIAPDDAIGGLLPEDKLRRVQDHLKIRPCVVMVGDGVNDAAALAAASVGIAVHGGAEASLAAATVYLRSPGLSPILQLTDAAARTLAVIRRSLYASLFYNALAVTLAVMGLINPLLAAILMPLSSLTVLSLALATRTFAPASSGESGLT